MYPKHIGWDPEPKQSPGLLTWLESVVIVMQGPDPGSPGCDLCRVGAEVGDRYSELDCLTFLIITKETNSSLLLPWKPSPWRQAAGRQLLEWEEVPAKR